MITGNGATSITDSNGVTLNVDATALANNTALTLVGSAAEVVSGLIGNITASSLTGALTVTTGDATDNTIAITTGSAATSITDSCQHRYGDGDRHRAGAEHGADAGGSAAEMVTGLVGDIAAGSLTGGADRDTGNAADNGISITTGSAATSITRKRGKRYGDGRRTALAREHGADAGRVRGRDGDRTGRRYRGRLA